MEEYYRRCAPMWDEYLDVIGELEKFYDVSFPEDLKAR